MALILVGRTPWSARDALVPLPEQRRRNHAGTKRPTGASAADRGVRPTNAHGPKKPPERRLQARLPAPHLLHNAELARVRSGRTRSCALRVGRGGGHFDPADVSGIAEAATVAVRGDDQIG